MVLSLQEKRATNRRSALKSARLARRASAASNPGNTSAISVF